METLLLGDSHLAQMDPAHLARLEHDLASSVEVAARGGAWSGDLRAQVGARSLRRFDAVLLSVGTNDAHPAYNSSPATLRVNLTDIMTDCSRAVLLLSPGVQQAPPPYDTGRLNAVIEQYVDVAASVVTEAGGVCVPTARVMDELGRKAWAPDGLHLSSRSYDLLLPKLADALRGPGAA